MRKKKRLCLVERPVAIEPDRPYVVVSMTNTVEWKIGDRLAKREVEELINRPSYSLIEVVVKGEGK